MSNFLTIKVISKLVEVEEEESGKPDVAKQLINEYSSLKLVQQLKVMVQNQSLNMIP